MVSIFVWKYERKDWHFSVVNDGVLSCTVKPNKLGILKTFVKTDCIKIFKLTNLILLSN